MKFLRGPFRRDPAHLEYGIQDADDQVLGRWSESVSAELLDILNAGWEAIEERELAERMAAIEKSPTRLDAPPIVS